MINPVIIYNHQEKGSQKAKVKKMTVREMVKDMDKNTNVRVFYTTNDGYTGYSSTKAYNVSDLFLDREVEKSRIKEEKIGGFASWQKNFTVKVVEITVKKIKNRA